LRRVCAGRRTAERLVKVLANHGREVDPELGVVEWVSSRPAAVRCAVQCRGRSAVELLM